MAGVTDQAATQALAETKEFDKLAAMLGMPESERRSILGVTQTAYRAWQAGAVDTAAPVAPEFLRRLAYALPLMRRMVANLPMLPSGRGQNTAQPSVN